MPSTEPTLSSSSGSNSPDMPSRHPHCRDADSSRISATAQAGAPWSFLKSRTFALSTASPFIAMVSNYFTMAIENGRLMYSICLAHLMALGVFLVLEVGLSIRSSAGTTSSRIDEILLPNQYTPKLSTFDKQQNRLLRNHWNIYKMNFSQLHNRGLFPPHAARKIFGISTSLTCGCLGGFALTSTSMPVTIGAILAAVIIAGPVTVLVNSYISDLSTEIRHP